MLGRRSGVVFMPVMALGNHWRTVGVASRMADLYALVRALCQDDGQATS